MWFAFTEPASKKRAATLAARLIFEPWGTRLVPWHPRGQVVEQQAPFLMLPPGLFRTPEEFGLRWPRSFEINPAAVQLRRLEKRPRSAAVGFEYGGE